MQAFLRSKDTFLPLHDKPGVSVYTVHRLYWLSLTLGSPSLSHTCRGVKGPEQGYLEAKCCVVLCLFVANFLSFLSKNNSELKIP